jgi:gamma-glutamyltranspeptidase/glutathione hydrolase
MVVSDNPLSSAVGVDLLRRGGNVIDAAVAVGFAQAVVNPAAGNIGGGGFLVFRDASGAVYALDYREVAPLAATATMYLDSTGNVTEESRLGPRAAGVPGAVAGLWAMHERFGTLPWRELVLPAAALADAHVLDDTRARQIEGRRRKLSRFPSSAAVFVRPDRAWAAGDTLRQPDLAHTLRLIAEGGADAFYRGPVAEQVEAAMVANGGLMTREDLARYRAEWRTPLEGTYRGRRIVTMPPASGGGATLLQALNILEQYDVPAPGSTAMVQLKVEALRRAFLDRNQWLGDPAFVTMPLDRITSKEYARAQAATIVPGRATPLTGTVLGEGTHTTHYSVMDQAGNTVAITTTLNEGFGSGFVVAGAGFLLNDEMDDFSARPGAVNAMGIQHEGVANAIAPGKRMLSSMTPTIVLDSMGRAEMVLGSEGGATIISTVFGIISNVVDHRMTLAEAMAWPRVHHNGLPDVVGWEPDGLSQSVRKELEKMGYRLWKEPDYMSTVNAIRVTERGLEGVGEPRLPGAATGF